MYTSEPHASRISGCRR
ncbi:MAG: hypothetical protein IPN33_18085 [Saprospiraceae bacterium]|nr:hypothetical protein [Saprospiraceae bacterium]